MTPRIQKKLRPPRSHESLRMTHPHAAGIDVHADIHWVAVPPGDAPPPEANHPINLPAHVRSFGTCTADLAGLCTEGHKDHARTMKLCVDCGEICSAAAKLAARQSMLAAILCDACAKACDVCNAACE